MPVDPYSQLIFIKHGNTTDEAIDYVNSNGTVVTNWATGGPSGTNTGLTAPIDIKADLPGGFYYIIDPEFTSGTADGQIRLGFTATPTVAPTSVYSVPDPAPPNAFGEAHALAIDTTNHILYLAQTVYSGSLTSLDSKTGIVAFNYDPTSGALTGPNFILTRGAAGTQQTDATLVEIRSMSLDTTHHVLYFTDDSFGKGSVVGVTPTNVLKAYDTVTHVETTVVAFPSGTDNAVEFPTPYTNGTIYAVTADPTDNLVFFSTASGFGGSEALNKIYVITAAGTGQLQLTEAAAYDSLAPFNMTFDDVHNQLYVSYEPTGSVNHLGALVRYDVNIPTPGSTTGITLSNPVSFDLNLDNSPPTTGTYPYGQFLDQLPALTTSGTSTHAAEQDLTKINLLTAAPIVTDSDNDHLASAYVQITGGTFVSNETSANDDHLSVLDGVTSKTSGTFTGTNITIAYDSATEKLTLTGYDTLANYAMVLSHVQYTTTGDNPTNYGNNLTRTITWHVSDGALDDPSGTNTTTTLLNIDAKNDAPVNHLPASFTALEDTSTTITGLSITDVDADPANQNITVTFSVLHGTLTVKTNVSGGIVAGDITASTGGTGAGVNIFNAVSITITATQNKINATLGDANGLKYLSDLNFNTGFGAETLHIVTNDNGHTDSAAFPGALGDTDDLSITVTAVNDPPNLQPDTTSPVSYIENAAATGLFGTETVTPDVDQSANYSGGSIDLNITAGSVTGDRISLTGATFHISGGNVQDSGNVNIGAISGNATSHVTISALTSAATPSVVDALIKAFGFDSTSEDPGNGARTVTLTFHDGGNTGGGDLTDAITQTVNVTPVNDPPSLTATGVTANYVENAAGTDLFSSVSVSAVEAADKIVELDLTVSGLHDGTNEILRIDGSDVTLTNGTSVTTATNGLSVVVSGTSSAVTVTITKAGNIAPGLVATVVDGITYSDLGENPTAGDRVITLTSIKDSGGIASGGIDTTSLSTAATITVVPVNDRPVVNATATLGYIENDAATAITPTATVTDVDSTDFNNGSLTVHFSANGTAEDQLSILTDANILLNGTTVQYDADGAGGNPAVDIGTVSGGVNGADLVITFNNSGNATPTAISALIDHVGYANNSDNPSTAARTVTFSVDDADGGNSPGVGSATINVTAKNDAPHFTSTPASYSGTPSVAIIINGIAFDDVDGNSGTEKLTFSAASGTFTTNAAGVTVTGENTSTISLEGTITAINNFIAGNHLSYTTATSQSISVTADDEGNTGTPPPFNLTANVNIPVSVDQPPVVDLNGVLAGTGVTLAYTENDAATVVASDGLTTDVDSTDFNGGSLTVHFSANGAAEDQLSILTDANILLNGSTVQYDADGAGGNPAVDIGTVSGGSNGADLVVTFNNSGNATAAAITSLIEHIQYANNSDNPSTAPRTLTYSVDDGDGATGSADATINITAVNDPPVVDLNGAPAGTGVTLAYTENDPATAIALVGTISDVDSANFNGGSLTVHFSANGAPEDQLSILTTGGVTVVAGVVSVGGNAVGTVSGGTNGTDLVISFNTNNATPAAITTLLEHIGYADNSDNPSTLARSLLFTLVDGDGGADTGTATATINVTAVNDAPAVDLNGVVAGTGVTLAYTENDAATVVAPDGFTTDVDSTDFDGGSLRVHFTANGTSADQLSILTDATVTIAAGVVSISGSAVGTVSGGTNGTDLLVSFNNTGNATPTSISTLIEHITYANSSDNPSTLARTLTFSVDDGDGSTGSANATINITAVNDPPVVDLNGALAGTSVTLNYTENDPATAIALVGVTTDVDSANFNGGSLTVHFSANGATEDQLSILTTGGVTVVAGVVSVGGNAVGTVSGGANGADLVIAFNTNNATPAAITTLLEHIGYADNSDVPSTAARSLLFTLIDGDGGADTGTATATINVTSVNDVPVFTNLGGPHPSFTENGSSVVLDNDVTVSDVEIDAAGGNYAGTTLTLARHLGANPDDTFAATGTLDLVDVSGGGDNVSFSGGPFDGIFIGTYTPTGDGTFSITFNSNATTANIAAAMHQIVYANLSDNPPASVQIDWFFNDGNTGSQGTGGAGIGTGSVTVDITQVDDAPFLLNVAVSAAYVPGSPGIVLSPTLIAGDLDATPPSPNVGIASATVKINAGFLAGDELFVNLATSGVHFIVDDGIGPVASNISVQSNVGGTLVLSGTDTAAHYQFVLDAVNYHSTAADPSNGGADPSRTITWTINDGILDNQVPGVPHYPETILHFDTPPVVDLDASSPGTGYTASYIENTAAIPIVHSDVSITDPDTVAVGQVTVVLTNAKPGDVLSIVGALPGGIGSSIDTSVPGQITVHLINSASFADYQTALQQIRFATSALDLSDRDITVVATGDETNSNVAHATVHVAPLHLFGTPGDDSFTALPGNEIIDAGGGLNDTITFGFRLLDATVTYSGNHVIIDGPGSHLVLSGFEKYVFTDGTVNNNDGNPLVDDLFYYSQYHDVWTAHLDADADYNNIGWHIGRDPNAFFSTTIYLSEFPDVRAAGVNPLVHFDTIGWTEHRIPSITFDPNKYLAANPDVAAAHVDPLAHFLVYGAGEGRQPIAPTEIIAANGFDYVYYLQHNPDVAAAHVDPLLHYELYGWKEGRNPNALFDNNGYLATYTDVAAAGVNPLDHYHLFGYHEGRDPSVNFDTTDYLSAYPDVAAAHVDPLAHYLQFGIHEGRSPFADGVWG